jgi:hypothetical protein
MRDAIQEIRQRENKENFLHVFPRFHFENLKLYGSVVTRREAEPKPDDDENGERELRIREILSPCVVKKSATPAASIAFTLMLTLGVVPILLAALPTGPCPTYGLVVGLLNHKLTRPAAMYAVRVQVLQLMPERGHAEQGKGSGK